MRMVVIVPSADEERQLKFINDHLIRYLEKPEYKQYSKLINLILESDSISAKYNLFTLLMNHDTDVLTINGLRDRLHNLYCADLNIEAYIDSIIEYNPKLNYISISSKSGFDINDNGSASINVRTPHNADVNKQFADASEMVKSIKDVLRIILTESKTIPF